LSLPGLFWLLAFVTALERLGLWFSGASWLPWRRRRVGMPVSTAGFDQVAMVLDAGKHRELEQRRTTSMMREGHEEGAPPHTTVDLDANMIRLVTPH
jgi:hypothetical protein